MATTDGIVAINDYTGDATAGAAIDRLLASLGDPDEVRSEGREAGSNLDSMSPVARAQLVVELEAMKDTVGAFA